MKHHDLFTHQGSTSQIIQVKNDVLVSNGLQLKAIESFHRKHPNMTVEQAAQTWIEKNAFAWRIHNTLTDIRRGIHD